MKIANPVYDVVFKYLMENNAIAIDMLSVILNVEIISLVLQSEEFTETSAGGIKVFRLDFKAVIKTKSGELKTILIEIQKAKNGFRISRFQTYLGYNYMKAHVVLNEKEQSEDERYPITVIYFLGFRLKNVKIPVLKVERQYVNAISNRKLNVKEDFVEKLSHDLYAIQIPRLKMHVRTELEQMLDVFNQNKYKTTNSHVLEYTGATTDPRVARVIKYLGHATNDNPDLFHAMIMEDLMETEAERDRKKLEDAENAKIEAEKATIKAEEGKIEAEKATIKAEEGKIEAEKATMEAEKKVDHLQKEVERLLLQLQNKQ